MAHKDIYFAQKAVEVGSSMDELISVPLGVSQVAGRLGLNYPKAPSHVSADDIDHQLRAQLELLLRSHLQVAHFVACASSHIVAGFQGEHPEAGSQAEACLFYDPAWEIIQNHFCHIPCILAATDLLKFKMKHVGPEILPWSFLEITICYPEA